MITIMIIIIIIIFSRNGENNTKNVGYEAKKTKTMKKNATIPKKAGVCYCVIFYQRITSELRVIIIIIIIIIIITTMIIILRVKARYYEFFDSL